MTTTEDVADARPAIGARPRLDLPRRRDHRVSSLARGVGAGAQPRRAADPHGARDPVGRPLRARLLDVGRGADGRRRRGLPLHRLQPRHARRPVRDGVRHRAVCRGIRAAGRGAGARPPRDRLAAADGGADGAPLRLLRRVHSGPLRPCGPPRRQPPRHAHHRRRRPLGRTHRHLGRRGRGVRDLRRGAECGRGGRGVHERRRGGRGAADGGRGEGLGAVLGAVRVDLGVGVGQRRVDRRRHAAGDAQARLSAAPRGRSRGGGLVRRADHAAAHGRRGVRDGGADRHALQRHRAGRAAGRLPLLLRRLDRDRRVRHPLQPQGAAGGGAACGAHRRHHLAVLPRPVHRPPLRHVLVGLHAAICRRARHRGRRRAPPVRRRPPLLRPPRSARVSPGRRWSPASRWR